MTSEIKSEIKVDLTKTFPTIIIGALTVVAGLAWNDAIQSLINYYVPEQDRGSGNAWVKILYALILTIGILILISTINIVTKKFK